MWFNKLRKEFFEMKHKDFVEEIQQRMFDLFPERKENLGFKMTGAFALDGLGTSLRWACVVFHEEAPVLISIE